MAAVVPPPLVSTTTSWEGVLVSAMDGAALAQAIEDLAMIAPFRVLSFYDARPAAVLGVVPFTMAIIDAILAGVFVPAIAEDGGGGGEERAEDGFEVDDGAVLAGDDDADVEINADESVMDDISPSDTDTALWRERVKELEKQNKALRRKARKHRSSRHRKRSKRHRRSRSSSESSSGSDSDSGSSSSSSSRSSLLSGDRERLDLGQDFVPNLLDRNHERFHVLLRDLRSACAASSSSWSSAVRVFPSLASRPLFVRELQLLERAGIKADVFSSRQRRNWASTIASIQDSEGSMEAELFIFRRLFGDVGESREIEGCVRVGNAFSGNS
ncbi:hypothetical protein BC829DRAFT_408193 [Chytridium lagenaria]|nr:hypothetical protein BC829DRAFT_408193 [Chytridium lagenaria]